METEPQPDRLLERRVSEQVIGAAIEVHRFLGPGLLESIYEECLCHELSQRGLGFRRQVCLPLEYKGTRLATDLIMDVVVDDLVLVELKSVASVLPVHQAQLLTYLKLSGLRVGLLINFNVAVLKQGITRRVL
ncbi:MAG: GxxExxY protein [Dehalococcoidia bacterium]